MQEQIGLFVEQFSWDEVEPEIQRRAKRTFLDTMAAIHAGASAEQIRMTAAALGINLECDAKDQAPMIFGYGHRDISLPDAVLLNAVSAHSCEYNDLFYCLPGHPSAVLVPVALGLGAHLRRSGRDMLEAYLCGLEVLGRVNEALIPEHHIRGFHSTSTAGIIGAAMAAGKLLKLNRKQLLNACSIAETFACGLRSNFGHHVISLHVGNAAANGLRAALFARNGISANRNLMELDDGYVAAFGGKLEKMKQCLGKLGTVSVLEQPGILLKKFPTCFSTYQAMEAAQEIVAEGGIDTEPIKRIECLTSPNHYMSLPSQWPESIYGQRFCVPFCVCWILAGGYPGIREFSQFHGQDEGLLRLKDKFHYCVDPQQEGTTGFGSTLVRVTFSDGTMRECRAWPNEQERVEFWSEESLKEKFMQCAGTVMSAEQAEAIRQDLKGLDQIPDIAEWIDTRWRKE